MPIKLKLPKTLVSLPIAKIGAFKVELVAGEWVDLWVTFGEMIDGAFVEHVDSATGEKVRAVHIHIEDGVHPLSPTTGLRRCVSCDKWYRLKEECLCGAMTTPYNGFSFLMGRPLRGRNIREALKEILYDYLMSTEVPDPDTWLARPLLRGELIK